MPAKCTKRPFFSKETADLVLSEGKRGGKKKRSWKSIKHSYKCPHCGFWHLTRKEASK
jgi:hypothetical protein